MGMPIWLIRLITKSNYIIYRASRGRLWNTTAGLPVIILSVTGRKTGKTHTFPIGALPDGERMVLIGSNGGRDQHPAWYHNILANPQVRFEQNGETVQATASVAEPEEYERLWQALMGISPDYNLYTRMTTRKIPLVILTPQPGDPHEPTANTGN